MDAAPRARRRWPWVLAAGVLALVAVGWLAGPRLACAVLAGRLPVDLGHGYELTRASTSPLPAPSQAALIVAPASARRLANSLHRVWVPPGMLRPGLTLIGTGRLPRDEVDFDWRLAVARERRSTLVIRLTPAEANDLFSPFRRVPVDRERGIFFDWEVREATARDDDRPGQAANARRVRIDAAGEMRLQWRSRTWRVEVRHLVAHLDFDFAPLDGRLRPTCRLTIDQADADLPRLPFTHGWRDLWTRIEKAADASFDKHLAKHPWPSGAPIDAMVDGRIGADAVATR